MKQNRAQVLDVTVHAKGDCFCTNKTQTKA